jgi:Flp pilus assembly protein CpaB
LAIAVVVLMAVSAIILGGSSEQTAVGMRTIVVAAVRLGLGTTLTNDNITEIPSARGSLPEGGLATKEELFKDGHRTSPKPALVVSTSDNLR